ncbi:MAG: MarR family transcriptional regulator [Rhodobacteraceae bacterium]|nr:MAG: MarR family transcriptional regulator [Paracoccaceae bacterium]
MIERSSETLIALRRIVHALDSNARQMARASQLTQAQLLVLLEVARKGHEMPRDIARALGVGQATVTLQIDKLEARGLVRRERRQADRRAVWVILTETGRALLDEIPDPLHERFTQRFNQLAPWEQTLILSVTERLGALFDADDAPAFPASEPQDVVAGRSAAPLRPEA